MANVRFGATSSATFINDHDTNSTWKTLALIKAANNHQVGINYVNVTVSGTTSIGLLRLIYCTNDGTGGVAVTPQKLNPIDTETIQTTITQGPTGANWSAEPTTTGEALFEVGFDGAGVSREVRLFIPVRGAGNFQRVAMQWQTIGATDATVKWHIQAEE